MTVVYLGAAWFGGIWLAAQLERGSVTVWATAALTGLLAAFWFRRRGRFEAALLSVCLAAAFAGAARQVASRVTIDHSHVAAYNDERVPVTVSGRIAGPPTLRGSSAFALLEATEISVGETRPRAVTGWIQLRTSRLSAPQHGQTISVRGALKAPDSATIADALARREIYSVMSYPEITVQSMDGAEPLRQALFALQIRAHTVINRSLPDPQASLLAGILLGDDSGLSKPLEEDFRTTGMTHIIAISGFNIAILAGLLSRLGTPLLGRRGAVWLALPVIALYTLFVGAEASVVRAAIMGSLYLLGARYLGRPYFALGTLFVAGFFMTLFEPRVLWDAGFQLSFMATLGLLLYIDPLKDRTTAWLNPQLGRERTRAVTGFTSEVILATLAAQVLVLPLLALHFRQLSLVSPLANLLVLPAQPGVMSWGGAATLAGLAYEPAGQALGAIAWLFLAYTTELVRILARLPGASVHFSLGPVAIVAYYALVFALTWFAMQESERRRTLLNRFSPRVRSRAVLTGCVLLALLAWQWNQTQPDGRLHVAFLDVGQGDAIFIQTPNGRQMLVDGGQQPELLNEQLGRQMPFWDRQIDVVVATHPDQDHVLGLPGVFERYQVDMLFTNGTDPGIAPIYDSVLMAAEADGAEIHRAIAGEVFLLDKDIVIEVLHPGHVLTDSDNENSVALRLVYGDFSVLLTGDAEAEAEQTILATGRSVQSLVFKAGHHGSRSSSNDFFLARVRPEVVIISAGADNNFGHPHAEVLERITAVGAITLRTDELGTIEAITDGKQLWWQAQP